MMATTNGTESSDSLAIPKAIGVSAAIVPTDVPIDKDMKQAATKMPGRRKDDGRSLSVRFTVASTAPMDFALLANAPARMNIHSMSMRLLSPAPVENTFTR